MRPPFREPIWIPAGAPPAFPDVREFEPHGLVAGGGDLSAERLLAAYRAGIFPWYDEPPILWWSPDPRAVLSRESLHVSRSLRRALRKRPFRVTVNHHLGGVLDGCGNRREGTWLSADMRSAYLTLERLGYVRSYEVWNQDSRLVGGLYGVLVNGLFAAESMFHTVTDASKVALVASVLHLFARGVVLYDVQFLTGHLARMGAYELPRASYVARLNVALKAAVTSVPDASEHDILPGLLTELSTGPGSVVESPPDGA